MIIREVDVLYNSLVKPKHLPLHLIENYGIFYICYVTLEAILLSPVTSMNGTHMQWKALYDEPFWP